MELFRDQPQSSRSALVRAMWAVERHKSTWALMARVWTFIRDRSEAGGYSNIRQYLFCAMDLVRTVPPEAWLATYNMVLFRDDSGGDGKSSGVVLRQVAPPAPGAIAAPRELSDFDLLKGVVLRGLAVADPEGLLRAMLEGANHVMTVNTGNNTVNNTMTVNTVNNGRADEAFVSAMDHDPLGTFATLLDLPGRSSAFDAGVNVIDVADVTATADYDFLVGSAGAHTHVRFQWDTSTAHVAAASAGALDAASCFYEEDGGRNGAYDLDVPGQWLGMDGQVTQAALEAGESCPFFLCLCWWIANGLV